jgi:hypothetical protein
MNYDLVEGFSKFLYLLTIFWCFWVWWRVYTIRKAHKSIDLLFKIQTFLFPVYSVYAILYIFDIAYHSVIGYLGWTIINGLFITTDLMMSKAMKAKLRSD